MRPRLRARCAARTSTLHARALNRALAPGPVRAPRHAGVMSAAQAAAYAARLQSAARSAVTLVRDRVVPTVSQSYTELMARALFLPHPHRRGPPASAVPLAREPLGPTPLPVARRRPPPAPHALALATHHHQARNQQYVVTDPVAAEKLGRQFLFTNLARRGAAGGAHLGVQPARARAAWRCASPTNAPPARPTSPSRAQASRALRAGAEGGGGRQGGVAAAERAPDGGGECRLRSRAPLPPRSRRRAPGRPAAAATTTVAVCSCAASRRRGHTRPSLPCAGGEVRRIWGRGVCLLLHWGNHRPRREHQRLRALSGDSS